MARRGRPNQTTHDEIRDVALRLFVEHGYSATSLAQIAHDVGISRTTLFSYFPAKHDLLWEEHDERLDRMRTAIDADAAGPLVDLLVAAMLSVAHYEPDEHDAMAQRWRIVAADAELRALSAQRTEQLTARLVHAARAHAARADAERVELVTRALMAVAARCTEQWSALPHTDEGLHDYTATRVAPFADALRPLLGEAAPSRLP